KENPGNNKEWTEHVIAHVGNIETTRAWDVDGDGFEEIVPNTPNHPLSYFKLERDASGKPTGKFSQVKVAEKQGHGLGLGDIYVDGRCEFIVTGVLVEASTDLVNGEWKFHSTWVLQHASAPIIVADVKKDGLNDIIVGKGDDYGLDWDE